MSSKKNIYSVGNKLFISVLAVSILVIGGYLYILSAERLKPSEDERTSNQISRMEITSESDEVEEIESDLDDTELENIDTEMIQIESELDAAINEL